MTHSEHFLMRLDRLSSRHTEEALLLYNDAPLLRSILELARVPGPSGRVALALGEDGPYLVVTRDGHFVTCLAAGMTVGDLPVVSRSQLEGLTCQVGGLRAKLEVARSVCESDSSQVRRVLVRLLTAGPELSREEFRRLAAFAPLMLPILVDIASAALSYLCKAPAVLDRSPLSRKNRKVSRAWRDCWYAYWVVGHVALLLGHDGHEALAGIAPELRRQTMQFSATVPARMGGLGHALRGAWVAGSAGKEMLAPLKAQLREARTSLEMAAASLSLVALGARHAGLRAEVLKSLACLPAMERFPGARRLQRIVHEASVAALRSPDASRELAHAQAEASLQQRRGLRGLPPGALPDGLVAPSLGLDINLLSDDTLGRLPALVVAVARLRAEELYAPQAQLDAIGHGPWTLAHSAQVIPAFEVPAPREPVVATARPGRNDACACGRGRKFKKCCGAAGPLLSAATVRQPAQARQHGARHDALAVGAHGGRAHGLQRPLVKLAG